LSTTQFGKRCRVSYKKKQKKTKIDSQHHNTNRKVKEVTSTSFEGLIGVNDVDTSWVRKWQQLPTTYVRGCYAVSVNGVVPHHIALELRDKRIPLVSRNRQFDPSVDLARVSAAAAANSVGNAAGNAASTFARPEPVRDTVEQEIDEIFE
jgi:hypothetical protein